MSRARKFRNIIALLTVALFTASCAAGPDNNQNTLRPKGEGAETIMNLFSPVFWIAVVIGVGVLTATIYVAIRYRETPKNKAPKQIHGNSVLEIGWTILPLLLLIGIAIPTVQTIFDLKAPAGEDALKVEVVGKQWWWQFAIETDEYELKDIDGTTKLDADNQPITSDRVVVANELVVPVNRQIDFDVKACNDDTPVIGQTAEELKAANPCNVIHSFWIPSLGGKIDAVPGRTNNLTLTPTQEGVFTGQCAEYCGLSHGVMRMQVRVVSEQEFQDWIAAQKNPPTDPCEFGVCEGEVNEVDELIRKFGCANCHAFNDPSEKTYGPNLTHFGPDFDNEVMASGIYEKNFEQTWRWIYNATDWENGWGIPMQADDCRLGPTPGQFKEGGRCVGMPDYSKEYTYKDLDGKTNTLPAMTEEEAQKIAKYLLGNK